MSSFSDTPLGDELHRELRALARPEQLRHFRDGEIIFSAGDTGDGFYLVESGLVQITTVVGDGESRVLATIAVSDFFGEMAVLDDAPRSATARAEGPTAAFFFHRAELLRLLERSPRLALDIVREFSARMRRINRKYEDDVLQAERLAAVGRFAQSIVHDFKNPLQVISFAGELVGGEQTAPALRAKAGHRIRRQVDRMSNMLTELIEFTKPAGPRPLLQRVDFAAFLAPLAGEIRQELADRSVRLELPAPPPALAVLAQPPRLSRLLYNLVNNAADALGGGGTIFLRFTAGARELRIEVEDTGPGIAPAIAATLFQPFATHGKAHGSGLGLSICKKIVTDQGGRLWVESPPGRGATFCFTLQRAE
ncbi:MAG: hypothetical protein RLZZ15_3807 [Verrucomicrobiota bacterium]|jgi:signal transduction histidine kinase